MQLPSLRTLEQVVRWGASQSPPLEIVSIVVQDEYTHDVVMRYQGERHLVFDST